MPITKESKRAHAERILRDYPSDHIKVLLAMARREGRWGHVDWQYVKDHLPE